MSNSPDHGLNFSELQDAAFYLNLDSKSNDVEDFEFLFYQKTPSLFNQDVSEINQDYPCVQENPEQHLNEIRTEQDSCTYYEEKAPLGFKFPSLLQVHQEAEMEKQKDYVRVKGSIFDNFDNLASLSVSRSSKHITKTTKQTQSKLKSLASRNIKCNFAASLENYECITEQFTKKPQIY